MLAQELALLEKDVYLKREKESRGGNIILTVLKFGFLVLKFGFLVLQKENILRGIGLQLFSMFSG